MTARTQRKSTGRKAVLASTAVAVAAAATALSIQFASADEANPEPAPLACTMETLPIPDGQEDTQVTAMSDDGSIVAYRAGYIGQGSTNHEHLLHIDGEATEIELPGPTGNITDVNDSGIAVGWTLVSPDRLPFIWQDGEVTELPTENGYGMAYGVNADGDIVGSRDNDEAEVPVIWPADGTGPVDLPLPEESAGGYASAIGDDGTIVGSYRYDDGNTVSEKPYVWSPDGTATELPVPEDVELADISSSPQDIKGDWVSGWLYEWDLETSGVRWNLADGTVEMTDLDETNAVSGDGAVAGQLPDSHLAAYQSEGTVVELPGGSEPAEDSIGDVATELSHDGTLIAGTIVVGVDENNWDIRNAVVWTCG